MGAYCCHEVPCYFLNFANCYSQELKCWGLKQTDLTQWNSCSHLPTTSRPPSKGETQRRATASHDILLNICKGTFLNIKVHQEVSLPSKSYVGAKKNKKSPCRNEGLIGGAWGTVYGLT